MGKPQVLDVAQDSKTAGRLDHAYRSVSHSAGAGTGAGTAGAIDSGCGRRASRASSTSRALSTSSIASVHLN
mgnify:CR=1 FL=1